MSILFALALLSTCADSPGCSDQQMTPELEKAFINLEVALDEAREENRQAEAEERELREAEEFARESQGDAPPEDQPQI